MLQRDVHVRERHRERARRGAAVAVLAHQRERGGAIGRDAGGERHAHERAGRQAHPIAQRRNRVEHGAGRAGQRAAVERQRVGGRTAAAEEARAIGFPFDRAASRPSTPSTWNAQVGASSALARPPAEQQAGALRRRTRSR